MLLLMFGLIFALLVVGALASLVAMADPLHARLAPFLGFPSLMAGAGALLLSIIIGGAGYVLDRLIGSQALSGLGFFFGYAIGGGGGAVSGFLLAARRVQSNPQ